MSVTFGDNLLSAFCCTCHMWGKFCDLQIMMDLHIFIEKAIFGMCMHACICVSICMLCVTLRVVLCVCVRTCMHILLMPDELGALNIYIFDV